ncbi:MAG TPA: hypothetical protein PKZ36_01235 [Candidatus Paceibacterota bacterium]|nr:hypothetical protein [Candidatus Paceibacterota bacterium]HPT18013.1 hypothetical protein [Candidatus Paceibacterota bacterium]
MDKPIDLLQIKIERAKESLPKETLKAINSVDWRAFILALREKKGYSFEQLEDLEIETELLLCGLLSIENYPKEIEERLKIPKPQVDLLINEMNESVFKKIREELIKNTEKEELFVRKEEKIEQKQVIQTGIDPTINKSESNILNKAGISIIERAEEIAPPSNTEVKKENPIEKPVEKPVESIPSQKLAGSFQIPMTKTEYSLNNKQNVQKNLTAEKEQTEKIKLSKIDPYRLDPNAE